MKLNEEKLPSLIGEALRCEEEAALESGSLGYMARAMVQATMPYTLFQGHVYERRNGTFRLTMMGHPDIGIPYGTYPRLFTNWMTTEAVRKKSPQLILGPSMSSFMGELGIQHTGGRTGTNRAFRDRILRLLTCSVSCRWSSHSRDVGGGFHIAKHFDLWWDPRQPDQTALWKSNVTLSTDFFEEIVDRPVPIDMRALKALKRSPMQIDIYCWLTYKFFTMKRRHTVPWELLMLQFGTQTGANAITRAQQKEATRNFKKWFLRHLKTVRVFFRDSKIRPEESGLTFISGKPHIPPQRPKS